MFFDANAVERQCCSRCENDAAERESEPASAERHWQSGCSASEDSANEIGNTLIKTEDGGLNSEHMLAEQRNPQSANAIKNTAASSSRAASNAENSLAMV